MIGPEWVSITEQSVSLILSKEKIIMKQYRFASCGDEVYKQTIIGNSFYLILYMIKLMIIRMYEIYRLE